MEIKLYNESSDRPHGSYEKIRIAEVHPDAVLHFTSQNGKDITTNLKFKITAEEVSFIDTKPTCQLEKVIVNPHVGGGWTEIRSSLINKYKAEPK